MYFEPKIVCEFSSSGQTAKSNNMGDDFNDLTEIGDGTHSKGVDNMGELTSYASVNVILNPKAPQFISERIFQIDSVSLEVVKFDLNVNAKAFIPQCATKGVISLSFS